MSKYIVLIPGDEDAWEKTSAEERARVYGQHEKFSTLLAERGHVVYGGAELAHSREAKVVRRSGEGAVVTDGPFAEAVEQVTGFYLVESDDLDDLLDCVKVLTPDAEDAVEVRRILSGED